MPAHNRPITLFSPVTEADHLIGPNNASVAVVEYGDFQCPNCKQAASALKVLLTHFAGNVQFAYRHFPLREVHRFALPAAESAESAGEQQNFWEMHDLLFQNQPNFTDKELRTYAQSLNLDLDRFDHDIRARTQLPRVERDLDTGVRSGVRSTPGIFVNGRIVDVSFGLHSLFDAVESELTIQQSDAQ
jgi:protein-disulfide isomerase